MPERNWNRDWEFLQRLQETYYQLDYMPYIIDFGEYWLKRVRELEEENEGLKAIIEHDKLVLELKEANELEERVRELEAQLNLQNQGLPVKVVEVEGEYDYIRKLEAQCMVMRKVLEFYAKPANYVQPSQMAGQTEHSPIEIDFGQKAREALSTTAGRELLERVKKLEAVAEAAREYTKTCACDHACNVLVGKVSFPCYRRELKNALGALDEALAALEKEA